VRRVLWVENDERAVSLVEKLPRHAAVGVRGVLSPETAAAWTDRVIAAEDDLVDDFGGEQRALGRAFYTHLDPADPARGRAPVYFRGDSDAVVEHVLPGMQDFTLTLLARLVGGRVRRRHGFCGPGVHVFPPDEKVAHHGGVFHYDLEGLTALDRTLGARALSLVVMLQPAARRGGLTLYNKLFRGDGWDMDRVPGCAKTTTLSRAGDALLFSSLRLHRINGFGGARPRVSITCHVVEVDAGVWDCWF